MSERDDEYDDEPVFEVLSEDDAHLNEVLLQLLSLRKQRKLSQKAVAARMATTQSHISDVERGVVDPRISTLMAYGRAVGARVVIHVERNPQGGIDEHGRT